MWRKMLVVVLFGASVANAEIKPFLELCFDAQFSMPSVKEVANVPESIRNAPIHHDDWGTPGPIAATEGNGPWLTELRFLRFGLRTDLTESIAWRNYVDLSLNYDYWFKWGADVNRRNYTNATGTEERGGGAALTFWSPNYDMFIPGFRSELCFNDSWFLGAGLRRYGVGIITGYDRYDRLDNDNFTRIGKLLETSVYGGWSNENIKGRHLFGDFRVGLNFNMYSENSEYRDIDVSTNKIAPFVAFNVGWRF